MPALTFTCQHDRCAKSGADRADFKKVEVQFRPFNFAYILCNEHAKQYEGATHD